MMIICFDIGGSAIRCALAASPSDIRPVGSHPTPLHDFHAFRTAIERLVKESGAPDGTPTAIAITGVIDEAGVIKCANISCIDGRRLEADLAQTLQRPVHVVNDADAFVLAEAMQGAGRGRRIVFGAILGTGVGGSLVVEGRLLRGAGGIAGEWGHGPLGARMAGTPPVPIPSFPCGCGQSGCVDTVSGARGMERLHAHLHGLQATSREIIDLWQEGDAEAERTIDVFVDLLAGPLSMVANVVGADIIPAGGGLSNSTSLISRIDEAVRSRILRKTHEALVVPATCRVEPGLVGAAILGFQEASHG